MKRLIALILALIMCAFAFVSCDNTDEDQNPIVTSENQQTTEKAESTDELYNGHGSAKLIPAQRESDGAQFYVSEYGSEELRKVWTSREWSDTPENVSFDFVLNQPEKAIYYNIESGIFVSGGKALKLTDKEKATVANYLSEQWFSTSKMVTSGGVTINTIESLDSLTQYEKETGQFLCADGFGDSAIRRNAGLVPFLTLSESLSFNHYDEKFSFQLDAAALHTNKPSHVTLKSLGDGLYYVYVRIHTEGDFIEEYNQAEHSTYYYAFILKTK